MSASAATPVDRALWPLALLAGLLPLWWSEPALKDALENITEWWSGAIFTAFFLLLACAWRSTGLRLLVRC